MCSTNLRDWSLGEYHKKRINQHNQNKFFNLFSDLCIPCGASDWVLPGSEKGGKLLLLLHTQYKALATYSEFLVNTSGIYEILGSGIRRIENRL